MFFDLDLRVSLVMQCSLAYVQTGIHSNDNVITNTRAIHLSFVFEHPNALGFEYKTVTVRRNSLKLHFNN